jgi:hypothetical protein
VAALPPDVEAIVAAVLAEFAEPIPSPLLHELPAATRRRTPAADVADPMYETDRERIWTDDHLSSWDRVRVVLGDLHAAARLLGDPDSARMFLDDVRALQSRDQWFASDDVAAAAREFVAAWHVGGPMLIADLDTLSEQLGAARGSYRRDDEQAAAGYDSIRSALDEVL